MYSWACWAAFGCLWVAFGPPLAPLGSLLSAQWPPLGCPWPPFGSLWAPSGSPCPSFGCHLGPFGPPWASFGLPRAPCVLRAQFGAPFSEQMVLKYRACAQNQASRYLPGLPALPAEMGQELLLGASLPHAPVVKMT